VIQIVIKTKKTKPVSKTTEDLLEEISKKLDKLTGILAIEGKDEDQKIKILTDLGFTSVEAGSLLGLPPGTIRRKNLEMRKG
jgi:hypothetical protein